MTEATTPEYQKRLAEFATRDPSEHLDRMVGEVVLGVFKAESRTIRSAADARQWDRLAEQIAAITAAGHIVVCLVGDD